MEAEVISILDDPVMDAVVDLSPHCPDPEYLSG
jgi:hypothetical protein